MERQEKKHRVLVVDDDPFIRLTLTHCLRAAGYDVETAGCLGSARAALDRCHFPVVITDLRLSKNGPMEGMEVVSHARKSRSNTGVIVMSGDLSDELQAMAHDLGAKHCHAKPYRLEEMLHSVRGIIDDVVQ